MFIAIISILFLMGSSAILGRALHFRVCPICAGVSATWLWMLGAKFLGFDVDMLVASMLMGGSVVGIAYSAEKKLPSSANTLLWKGTFVPAGFVFAYALANFRFSLLLASGLALLAIILINFLFLKRSSAANKNVVELEKKMKECC